MTGKQGQTNPGTADAEARRWQALELRKQAKSFRQIAAELGVSLGQAHRDVCEALAELREHTLSNAEQLRDMELQKLDSVEAEMRKRLEGADDQDAAKLSAIILKTAESRRKLLGLDAPTKVEATFTKAYFVKDCSPEAFPEPPPKDE